MPWISDRCRAANSVPSQFLHSEWPPPSRRQLQGETTVDANQFLSIANHASTTLDALAQTSPSAPVPSGSSDFANLFNGQMLAQGRQEFAAPVPVQLDLQLVPLGPKMNVITADAPLPDMASLASFARAQGLDEEAVTTLFGSATTPASQGLVALPLQMRVQGPAAVSPEPARLPIPMPPRIQASSTGLAGLLAQSSVPARTPENGDTLPETGDQTPLMGLSDTTAQLAVPTPVIAMAFATHPAPVLVSSAAPVSLPQEGAALERLLDVSVVKTQALPEAPVDPTHTADPLAAYLVSAHIGARPQPPVPVTQAVATEQPSHPAAAPMQLAMRVRLDVPHQEITRRLSLMSGSAQKASWAAIAGNGLRDTAQNQAWETLPIDIPSALLAELNEGPAPRQSGRAMGLETRYVGTPAAVMSGALVPATATAVDPFLEIDMATQRGATQQPLEDRRGQPLVQLPLLHLEKGEWSAKPQVPPDSPGRAGVALSMRAVAPDASVDVPSIQPSDGHDGTAIRQPDVTSGPASLAAGPADPGKPSALNPAMRPSPETPSEMGLVAQRSAQYQQLADRVGQTLGNRLLSQIEKGEWNLKLRLQPESLGRVDVALAMHAGALDASFASDNSMTRDLILQGAGRLRDTLAESGMAVANVWVGGDQGRKNDGNPTPGRSFKDAPGSIRRRDGEPVIGVSAPARNATAGEGLDILA